MTKMKKPVSKKDKVLAHLKRYGKITPIQALNKYGCMRLADIIFKLRKDYDIKTLETATTDQYGNKVYYATYVMDRGT